jgi:hypothetical protein
MELGIKKAINNGNGDTIIYTALIAAMLANAIPTIADGYYFSLLQKWKQELAEGKMTPEKYWTLTCGNYYTITAGYYGVMLLAMMSMQKSSFSFKSKILLGMIGGGLVLGVAMKNIQKDKEIAELKKITS